MNKDWYKKEFGSEAGVKEILVTPEMAERWLNTNTHNRPLVERRVKKYKQAIIEGKWVPSNDCLVIYDDGTLGNGQHRLWALAETKGINPNLKAPLLVRWGMPNKISKNLYTMDFIDRGSGRTGGQNWGLRNKLETTKTRQISAISNLLAQIVGTVRRTTLEALEIDFIYHSYRQEFDLILDNDRGVRKFTRAPVWTALVFAAKVNPEKALKFEELLFTGENLPSGNPILTFRNRILFNSSTEGRGRVTVFKELLTAMRSFIEEEPLFKIYTNDKGYSYFVSEQKELINKISKFLAIQPIPEEPHVKPDRPFYTE